MTTITQEAVDTIAKYTAKFNGRTKFEEQDIYDHGSILGPFVVDYVQNYDGDFAFMVDMKRQAQTRGQLMPRQVAGVLNCMVADIRRQRQQAQMAQLAVQGIPDEIDLTREPPKIEPKVGNGTYSVLLRGPEHPEDYATIRLVTCKMQDTPPGTQIAQYLTGPDNERDYAGFAFVAGSKFRIWKRFADNERLRNALIRLLRSTDPTFYGYRWALQSGRCYICGRTLTVPASIGRGIGPECAKKSTR